MTLMSAIASTGAIAAPVSKLLKYFNRLRVHLPKGWCAFGALSMSYRNVVLPLVVLELDTDAVHGESQHVTVTHQHRHFDQHPFVVALGQGRPRGVAEPAAYSQFVGRGEHSGVPR